MAPVRQWRTQLLQVSQKSRIQPCGLRVEFDTGEQRRQAHAWSIPWGDEQAILS